MSSELFNANPTVFSSARSASNTSDTESDGDEVEEIDQDEIFGLIRTIYDPEHPNTLEELRVVSAPQITIKRNHIVVEFTPTVPHCGMSTLIGLSIRVRLLRSLPSRYKVDIFVKPGSHQSEHSVNKQLNDKERVAAALENPPLVDTVEKCLSKPSPILQLI
ncbi:FAM96B protein [Coprinellus micaceus]|uniref:FAM96B protein n=1 Tax=Coprinellus micaceus TaxID=71717 RepID=A0A4Y7TRJ4_COPMI|nr:FAM96B protein [Coprinellus micaceus]